MTASLPIKIARPYAKAAFAYARAAGTQQEWQEALKELSVLIQHELMDAVIKSPRLSAAKKADCVGFVLKETLSEPVLRFVSVLAQNRRLALMPAIAALFDTYFAEEKRTVSVGITSAVSLSPSLIAAFQEGLKKRLDRDVSMSVQIDASLIGGAIIRAGDLVMDGSLRSQLQKMAEVI